MKNGLYEMYYSDVNIYFANELYTRCYYKNDKLNGLSFINDIKTFIINI